MDGHISSGDGCLEVVSKPSLMPNLKRPADGGILEICHIFLSKIPSPGRLESRHRRDVAVTLNTIKGFETTYRETGASPKMFSTGCTWRGLRRFRPSPQTMKNVLSELIKTLGVILEEKSPELKRHSDRVASLAVSFARRAKLPGLEVKDIYLAGLLHDFGQIYLEPAVLEKPTLPKAEQLLQYRHHPQTGERLLSHITAFKEILPLIRHHHEYYDGSGFPDGLKGEQIPAGARIIGLADHYDRVMAGWVIPDPTVSLALETIRKSAGSRFDPHLVAMFVPFIESDYGDITAIDDNDPPHQQPRNLIQKVVRKIKAGEAELKMLPEVFHKVESAINSPHAVDEVVKELEKDAAITLKLISVANSSFYGGIDRITSVRGAVTRLGLKEVRNIIASITVKGLYRTRNRRLQKLMQQLWLRSLTCAYTARAIAQRLERAESENLYLAGLLGEIGKVQILGLVPEKFVAEKKVSMDALMAVVNEFHQDVGAFILQYWGLGDRLSLLFTVAEDHDNGTPSRSILALAGNLAGRMGHDTDYEDFADALEGASQLDLGASTIERICLEVEKAMESCIAIF